MEENDFKVLVEYSLPIVTTIMVPVLGALAVAGYRRLSKLLGRQIDQREEGMLLQLIADGTAFAEQQTHLWARESRSASSSQKLEWAASFVSAEIQRRGLPELARDALVAKVEAQLGVERKKASLPTAVVLPIPGDVQ